VNVKELKVLIDVLVKLGHGDSQLVIDDSRDGNASYPLAEAVVVRSSGGVGGREDNVMLTVRYK
jgi:hypothetical protein